MINSRPNNSNYNQGNYLPINRDKVIKFNNEHGVYYRSSWEKILMIYFDNCEKIIKWGAECLTIPYEMEELDNSNYRYGDMSKHNYYPDFYYELKNDDGAIEHVVVEVKPSKEVKMVNDFINENMKIPNKNTKLKNFEYDFKTAYKNSKKWSAIIKYCNIKGYKFIIVTEETLHKYKLL